MAARRSRKTVRSKKAAAVAEAPAAGEPDKLSAFGKRVIRTLPLVLLAILFTFVINRSGLFADLESSVLDARMNLDMPEEPSPVVVIDIDDNDLYSIFDGQTRPLNPKGLQRLLDAVSDSGACVVGIDLGTSFDRFREFKVTEKMSNFVWTRSTAPIADGSSEKPVPLDVLGGLDPLLNQRSGVSLLEEDNNHVTRYYSRSTETTQGILPSLPWAIFEKAREQKCPGLSFHNARADTDSLLIGFSRGKLGEGRLRLSASSVLKFAEQGWENNDVLRNKVVLVGGTYGEGDRHATPLGEMSGVAIHANVVETELNGGGTKPPGLLSIILLQVFDGFLLMSLFQLFSWRKAILLSLPFIVILAAACSFFTYFSLSYWVFFAPVMLGVLATELFDKAKDHLKKRYKKEISDQYAEITGRSNAGGADHD